MWCDAAFRQNFLDTCWTLTFCTFDVINRQFAEMHTCGVFTVPVTSRFLSRYLKKIKFQPPTSLLGRCRTLMSTVFRSASVSSPSGSTTSRGSTSSCICWLIWTFSLTATNSFCCYSRSAPFCNVALACTEIWKSPHNSLCNACPDPPPPYFTRHWHPTSDGKINLNQFTWPNPPFSRISPFVFQAGGRSRRPNLALVFLC